jgi:uncharacterized protein YgfB (UPF0149 family)
VNHRTDLFDFESLECVLDHNDPADLHGLLCGMLCGMLCVDSAISNELCLERIEAEFGAGLLSGPAQDLFKELFYLVASQLDDADLGFALFLPTDHDTLNRRLDALKQWCEGFLAGLVLAGLDKERLSSPEVKEFLADLVEICRLDAVAGDGSEEQEAAYMEIAEYVRMGVLLVNEELNAPPPTYRH